MKEEDKLSNAEQRLFNQLPKETQPPERLEKAVLKRAKKEGLIKRNVRYLNVRRIVTVAASVILFFCGILFERYNNPDSIQIQPTKGYMLLLLEDSQFQPNDNPMVMFDEYKKWSEYTLDRGVKITGQELKQEVVRVNQSGIVSNAPIEKHTTGYFILEAESLDEAIEIARANPHIKYGGTIDVKPYMVR